MTLAKISKRTWLKYLDLCHNGLPTLTSVCLRLWLHAMKQNYGDRFTWSSDSSKTLMAILWARVQIPRRKKYTYLLHQRMTLVVSLDECRSYSWAWKWALVQNIHLLRQLIFDRINSNVWRSSQQQLFYSWVQRLRNVDKESDFCIRIIVWLNLLVMPL